MVKKEGRKMKQKTWRGGRCMKEGKEPTCVLRTRTDVGMARKTSIGIAPKLMIDGKRKPRPDQGPHFIITK